LALRRACFTLAMISNRVGVVGAPDNETALEWAKKFKLEGAAQRIECAFLVLHGENDRIVPLAEAKKLYEESARNERTSRFSPPRRVAPSTAKSITASSASITSATGCSRACKHPCDDDVLVTWFEAVDASGSA
jgi:hypothetical protein